MTQQGGEEFLTPEEAGAMIGVSRRTLERYVEDKKIKRYKRGFRVYYKRNELARLQEIREEEPKSEQE